MPVIFRTKRDHCHIPQTGAVLRGTNGIFFVLDWTAHLVIYLSMSRYCCHTPQIGGLSFMGRVGLSSLWIGCSILSVISVCKGATVISHKQGTALCGTDVIFLDLDWTARPVSHLCMERYPCHIQQTGRSFVEQTRYSSVLIGRPSLSIIFVGRAGLSLAEPIRGRRTEMRGKNTNNPCRPPS